MSKEVVSLRTLLESKGDVTVKKLLTGFSCINLEVETFLNEKAIFFEKASLASTYLVLDFKKLYIHGFFSIANRQLLLKEHFIRACSKNKLKQFKKHSKKLDTGDWYVNSFLLGQIGKNSQGDNELNDIELLALACNKLIEAASIIATKYIWLECKDHEKLLQFYEKYGFTKIDVFESKDEFVTMLMPIVPSNPWRAYDESSIIELKDIKGGACYAHSRSFHYSLSLVPSDNGCLLPL